MTKLPENSRKILTNLFDNLHWQYTWLDRFLPGTGLLTVAKKILIDQSLASPYFNFSFFMGSGMLEGNGLKGSWDEFKDKFVMVYKVTILFYFFIIF